MKIIGYWLDADDPSEHHYPDPRLFVKPGWISLDEKRLLLNYLRPPQFGCGAWGYSWCRFECGATHKEMGSLCYSDGVWMWPQGLAHYLELHDVVLPNDFMLTCRSNDWICPAMQNTPSLRSAEDQTYWLKWSTNYLNPTKDRTMPFSELSEMLDR